jgi:hypothetical protein
MHSADTTHPDKHHAQAHQTSLRALSAFNSKAKKPCECSDLSLAGRAAAPRC